jgi:hypothetical protein
VPVHSGRDGRRPFAGSPLRVYWQVRTAGAFARAAATWFGVANALKELPTATTIVGLEDAVLTKREPGR